AVAAFSAPFFVSVAAFSVPLFVADAAFFTPFFVAVAAFSVSSLTSEPDPSVFCFFVFFVVFVVVVVVWSELELGAVACAWLRTATSIIEKSKVKKRRGFIGRGLLSLGMTVASVTE